MREGNKPEPLGSVMVVGAGIGGMQAALDLANAGFYVYLTTDEPSVGGTMSRLDKTFPTNDCAMCLLGPKMTDCQSHPNIELLTNSTVVGLDGDPGNFTVRVSSVPRYVNINECTACGECEKVCPVEVPNPFNLSMNNRKAIYKLFPQAVPNRYAIEKRGIPPCRQTCPAGTNVQGYVALISQGKFKEALEVIRRRLPFPGILGRICHHPCESQCNRGEVDAPVSICALKRAAADYGWSEGDVPTKPEITKSKTVAVVGAGPAGLTAALDLVKEGYKVTVYDSLAMPGGMMFSAIPRYRLPLELVKRETDYVLSHGIEFKPNQTLGKDVKLEELQAKYDAVLLAIGTQKSRSLSIEGINSEGVFLGLDFLKQVNLGDPPSIGKHVIVIGGGNVAMDTARTALRLGAAKVEVACLESRQEMPAHEWEIQEALEEGITLHPSWGPKRVVVRDGKVAGIELVKCVSVFDSEGKFNPKFDETVVQTLECDTLMISIGQASDTSFLPADSPLRGPRPGMLNADPVTGATPVPGVFACGDVVHGPKSVVEAIAAGHEAAISIARYLEGQDLLAGRQLRKPEKLGPPERIKPIETPRVPVSVVDVKSRVGDFREVAKGYSRDEAVREARLCLNCGICSECLQCVAACPKHCINHEEEPATRELQVGAVILAPGFGLHDALTEGEYGYGIYPNVITSLEFERLLSATGPTEGKIVRPSDGSHPKRIAFIQCVGSRDAACGAEYCSSICCMYSTKEAVIAKEHEKEIEPTIFYLDVRAFGKGFDRYVESAKKNYGVRYVRSMISSVKQDPSTKNLLIKYYADGELREEEFDLVVLAVGVRPPKDSAALAANLGFELNEYGFAKVDEVNPVATTRPGVFVAGGLRGPQDIPETVMTASAAAAAAAELLAPGRNKQVKIKEYPPERDVSCEQPRVGVFICRCGINIASVVNVPEVVAHASKLPGVVHAQEFMFTCSQDSLKLIREAITEHNLNRVVVASCTIRTHQPLFRENLREAGLNQFLFEMANIRDQCSWVHQQDPEAATEKAKDLVTMAVAKVKRHQALGLHPVPVVPKALVIGGGVAGMTAALSLANQGFGIYLLEREAELGGNLRKLKSTLEGLDVQGFLADLKSKVENHPLIEVMKNSQLVEMSGHAGHFTSVVAISGGDGTKQNRTVEHGVVIVATGAVESKPEGYMYGKDVRIVSGMELERLIDTNDPRLPTMGVMAMILCVGSRNDARGYCSRTCCAQSIKNAIKMRRRRPNVDVVILYRDVRTYGFMEKYYKEARELGVLFIPYGEANDPQISLNGSELRMKVRDELSGMDLDFQIEMLVLASATVASEGTSALASLLKVPVSEEGFLLETHIKLGPIDFPSQGLFLCGSAHWPKFISESIYQAQGAAARAATILSKRELLVGGVVAVIDQTKCAACLTCVRVCPFSVPFINENGVAEINPVQCQGCGTCAGECPAKAIQLQHYTDEQVIAKVHELFQLQEAAI